MMYGMNKKIAMVCVLSLSAALVSCAAKESDKVGEAQLCLDTAAQGAAAACTLKVSGIESAAASLIRCSAGFIDEGFTQPARFKSAFDALGTSSSTNTETFLGVLAFNSKSTAALNLASANTTYDECAKSKAKGFMLLGSMAKTATTLSGLAGSFVNGAQPTQADITTAINNAIADPTATASIGSAVTTTYTASCQTGQKSNEALCTQFDAALVGVDKTNSAAVGAAVLNYWKNN